MKVRARSSLLVAVSIVSILVGSVAPAVAYPRPGRTELISGLEGGGTPSGISTSGNLSADGRYVMFNSSARDLVEGKTLFTTDVFVRDRQTGRTERVSVAGDGTGSNQGGHGGGISADGRYVVFTSFATNLVPDDTNGSTDTFVHDRATGQTERVSVAPDGTQANAASQNSAISADGRYVAFASRATNLSPEATNGQLHAFVKDLVEGDVYLASRSTEGLEGNAPTFYPSLSADGRYAVFYTFATNLVAGDTNSANDVYVHDIVTRRTERASLTWNGGEPNDSAVRPTISADGRYVAFSAYATNMVPSASNPQIFPYDVYVRDRQARTTTRVSTSTAGVVGDSSSYVPQISADGRFITFTSDASNLVRGDNNGLRDAYIHDRELVRTERISVGPNEEEGDGHSHTATITTDGGHAAFFGQATNFVSGDDNGEPDVFVRERGGDLDIIDPRATVTDDSVRVVGDATFSGTLLSRSPIRQLLIENSGLEVRGAELLYHPEEEGLLFRWHLNGLHTLPVSRTPLPAQYFGYTFTTPTGRYEIRIQDDLQPQLSTRPFGTRVELYKCESSCVHVADLAGSLGTTGSEARAVLPLKTIDLAEGDPLTGMRAYIALGHRSLGESGRIEGVNVPDAEVARGVVRVGTAPAGAPIEDAELRPIAVDQGHFETELPAPTDSFRTWMRICLGQTCSLRFLDVDRETVSDPEPSALTLTLGKEGGNVVLVARLVDGLSGAALGGREIGFDLNGTPIGAVSTDASGAATLEIPKQQVRPGDEIRASFAGDDDHLPSEAIQRYSPGRS